MWRGAGGEVGLVVVGGGALRGVGARGVGARGVGARGVGARAVKADTLRNVHRYHTTTYLLSVALVPLPARV